MNGFRRLAVLAFAAFALPAIGARYHSGVLPDMVETVRGEIQELLK